MGSSNAKRTRDVSPDTMPDPPQPVRFDLANENDDADIYKKISSLKQPFNESDPKFWFNTFERSIKHMGVISGHKI